MTEPTIVIQLETIEALRTIALDTNAPSDILLSLSFFRNHAYRSELFTPQEAVLFERIQLKVMANGY
jgi:hypothetical protein